MLLSACVPGSAYVNSELTLFPASVGNVQNVLVGGELLLLGLVLITLKTG